MSLKNKLQDLNNADLSVLMERINKLRRNAEQTLKIKDEADNLNRLLDKLEEAKRRGTR